MYTKARRNYAVSFIGDSDCRSVVCSIVLRERRIFIPSTVKEQVILHWTRDIIKMVFIAALLVGVMSVGAVVSMAVSGSVHMMKTVEKDNRRSQDLIKSRTTPHNQYQAVY
jgi:hypothetical protein